MTSATPLSTATPTPTGKLCLVDEATGSTVEIPLAADGKTDILAAAKQMQAIRDKPSDVKTRTEKPDPALIEAQSAYERARATYVKTKFEYKKALAAVNAAKTPKAKKDAETKLNEREIARHLAYEKYLEKKDLYEKAQSKAEKKYPFDPMTSSAAGFGKKRFLPRSGGVKIAVVPIPQKPESKIAGADSTKKEKSKKPLPKTPPKIAATSAKKVVASKAKPPVATSEKKAEPPKPPEKPAVKPIKPPAAVGVKPMPKEEKKVLTPVKIEAPKAPVVAKKDDPIDFGDDVGSVDPKPIPENSQEKPLTVSTIEKESDGKITVTTDSGAKISIDPKTDPITPHGGVVKSVTLKNGKVVWLKEKAEEKPVAPPPFIATPMPTVSPLPVPTGTSTATPPLSGGGGSETVAAKTVSDADAAEYTVPVAGYPIEGKFPFYLWKHKSSNQYLAVQGDKRILLGQGNFDSLDQKLHPEHYQ